MTSNFTVLTTCGSAEFSDIFTGSCGQDQATRPRDASVDTMILDFDACLLNCFFSQTAASRDPISSLLSVKTRLAAVLRPVANGPNNVGPTLFNTT